MPVAAQADTFFVSKSGSGTECSEAAPCATISLALTASRAAGGTGDRIEVGPGLYEEQVMINDANDAGLTLHGAGRGPDRETTPTDATTVRSPETNKGDEVAISVAPDVSVESLRVEVPAGFVNTAGIELGGPASTARDVHVESAGGINTGAIEVAAKTPEAKILNARVRHIGDYWGIAIFGPGATVSDSDVRTAQGQALDTESFGETALVVRSRFETAGGAVATIRSPDVVIDSSLLIGGSLGVETYASFGEVNLVTLSNDTIDVGKPKVDDHSGVAARARAETGATASITLINSVAVEKQEVEGSASQAVTCKESVVPLQAENGPKGEIECGAAGGNVFASPAALFATGEDWHLLPGSVAVDTGSEGDPLTSTDLDGRPRVVDGNGDGSAVIDRGAYELPTPVPVSATPHSSPSNAFKFGKLKRNKGKGTAKLQVEVPGPGQLMLTGKKVKKKTLDAKRAGTLALAIVPKSQLAGKLKSKGAAQTSIKVTFTPSGGTANARTKSVKLIRTS